MKKIVLSLIVVALLALIIIEGPHLLQSNHSDHQHEDHAHDGAHQSHQDHGHQTNNHSGHTDHHEQHGHDDHGHDEHGHQEAIKGEHGGKILEQDHFKVELTIFESGVPPEMRLYSYYKDQLINPADIESFVMLERLGGETNLISFRPEQDYLVSDQLIAEPHSYAVTLETTYQGKDYQWQYESHEGRVEISERLIKQAGIQVETVSPQTIYQQIELYGIIETPQNQRTRVFAPYSSRVEKVYFSIGDQVKKGQRLATLKNLKTLQSYHLQSPVNGEITQLDFNRGEIIHQDALLQITDYSKVWVSMSAFPKNMQLLKMGQPLTINSVEGSLEAQGIIDYISPKMTEGHIARVRSTIDNPNGNWRPGMHVKSQITVSTNQVPMAIKRSALQRFRGMPVVFAKFDKAFEVRMVKTGLEDDHYLEVISGIKPGTQYATENSFLLKSDSLKEGAAHDH